MTIPTYPRPARRHEQAHQIWNILIGFVGHACRGKMKKKGLITYGELAAKMGYSPQTGVTLDVALGTIARFCAANDLPYLNAIVVNAETGRPGHDVIRDANLTRKQERREILEFDWFSIRPPSMRAMREASAK